MNLTRMGHYHVPSRERDATPESGDCIAAIVTHVWSDAMVNIVTFDGYGRQDDHSSVSVQSPDDSVVSFHLSQDCPWKR